MALLSLTTENRVATEEFLSRFISAQQLSAMADANMDLSEIAAAIRHMPKTYEQDGMGEKAMAHLHYFIGGCDWYITERDVGCDGDEAQHQAFGMASMGYEPEMGYISIAELIENGVELDLYFTPRTIAECRQILIDRNGLHSPS